MRSISSFLLFSVGLISTAAIAQDGGKQRTAAQVFGAVPAVYDISLSPDGTKVAFIAPGPGTMTDLFAIDLNQAQANPKRVTRASGDPENLQWCNWVSNERMACKLGGIERTAAICMDSAEWSRSTAMAAIRFYYPNGMIPLLSD
jgi:hypothetical protein